MYCFQADTSDLYDETRKWSLKMSDPDVFVKVTDTDKRKKFVMIKISPRLQFVMHFDIDTSLSSRY